jgi:hypothetical protein
MWISGGRVPDLEDDADEEELMVDFFRCFFFSRVMFPRMFLSKTQLQF